MPTPRPIEIVGGGLAGLALGLSLRRAGVPVTLFDSGTYPRHRVCGEFIAGLGPNIASRLGLGEILADAYPNRTVLYHLRDQALPPYRLPETAWGISRHALDGRVARAFAAAGGELRTRSRVEEEELRPGRVFAIGRRPRPPMWVGLKAHFRDFELSADLEVHLGDRAYIGLSRVQDGAINACALFGARKMESRGPDLLFDSLAAAGLGRLAARLKASRLDSDSFCACAASLGDPRCAPADRIRVGDACAVIPPFTGNGLAMALQGAELASPLLRDYAAGERNWDETVAEVGRAQRRAFRRRLAAADRLHPFMLYPARQRILAAAMRARLRPLRLLYWAVH